MSEWSAQHNAGPAMHAGDWLRLAKPAEMPVEIHGLHVEARCIRRALFAATHNHRVRKLLGCLCHVFLAHTVCVPLGDTRGGLSVRSRTWRQDDICQPLPASNTS